MTGERNAIEIVKVFLKAMDERDIERASSLLASDVKLIYPGTGPLNNLDELINFGRKRYQWIRKNIEGIDSLALPEGDSAVYVMGQLYGVNLSGAEFSGVRFIDRYVIRDGRIVAQEVWNDLAESGVLLPS